MAKNYNSKRIRGKLKVYQFLADDTQLQRLVPPSRLLNMANLEHLLKKYSSVYMKPDVGSQGIGVYKLTYDDKEKCYHLFTVLNKKQHHHKFKTVKGAYMHVRKKQGDTKMLVQRAVRLDEVKGRPYDIRAMVQRKPKGAWVCTGFLVKVGRADKVVTNYHQGGEIITIKALLKRKGFSQDVINKKMTYLTNKALQIARCLSKRQPGMCELGIDFAYDRNNRLWLLEVNSNHPQFHPLKQLDKAAYNKMMFYAKSYGRSSAI